MATQNALFAIFNVSDAAAVAARLQNIPSWPNLKLEEGQWLLIAPSSTTSKEVSDRLGFSTSNVPLNGVVVRVENYFGRNPPSTWEWIVTKQGAEIGTQTV